MYKNYKSSAVQSKKPGLPKGQQKSQNTSSQKIIKPKPEWNDSIGGEVSYKLTTSEQVQRKISLMSKHRLQAKEEWLERQEKLRNGVYDEETKRVYDTARQSKNLSTRDDDVQRRNLSQMLNFIPKPQRDPKAVVESVNDNLKQTRKFIEKMEQYQNDEDPNRLLRVMDRLHTTNQTTLNKYDSASQFQGQKGVGSLRKSARSMSNQNLSPHRSSSHTEQRFSDKKLTQPNQTTDNGFFSTSSSKENKQDMANYFNSLDKIEETIRFMEDKILGEKKSPKKQGGIAPSTLVEKKLFNEIKEITENDVEETNVNQITQKRQYQFDIDNVDFSDDIKFPKPQNFRTNKFEGVAIENIADVRGSDNGNKYVNLSRQSKTIDNDALSFNLTDGEEESQFNQSLPREKNKNANLPFERKIQERQANEYKNNIKDDQMGNDFNCNLDMLDPNMFFNNNVNNKQANKKIDDTNELDYEYDNLHNKKQGELQKRVSDDAYKSDFQKSYEDTLTSNKNPYERQRQSNLAQNYDLIAEKKRQELNSQQSTEKFSYNQPLNNNKPNDIFSKLKQQTEDDSDHFYSNRVIPKPQSNNYFRTTINEETIPSRSYQNKTESNNYLNQQKPSQYKQQEEEQEEEDYLSRNIDQLKEMLEATKKDLEKLDNNQDNDELNYFSSQYALQNRQNEGSIHGKKMQRTIPISVNNEQSNLQAQQSVTRVNNPLTEQSDTREYTKQSSNLPLSSGNQYKMSEKNNAVDYKMQPETNNQFQNNYFQEESGQQQTFFTSNIFLSNNANQMIQQGLNSYQNNTNKTTTSNNNFTSNVFLNNREDYSNNNSNANQYGNTTYNKQNQTSAENNNHNSDIPRHYNVVKQDMFKKSLQNYSNQNVNASDSLNIKHHLK